MATTLNMRASPLPNPAVNLICFRMIVKASSPPPFGAAVNNLGERRVQVPFDPRRDMSSQENAFGFIKFLLAAHLGLPPGLCTRLAMSMVPFALSSTGSWPYGLILINTIETTCTFLSQLLPPPPLAVFSIQNNVSHFPAGAVPSFPGGGGSSEVETTTYAPRGRRSELPPRLQQHAPFVDDSLVLTSYPDGPGRREPPSLPPRRRRGSPPPRLRRGRVLPPVRTALVFDDDLDLDDTPAPFEGMSESEISSLTKERFSGEEGEACCICLDEFTSGAMMTSLSPCSHKFHGDCIAKWLRQKKTCPMCRTTVLFT